MNDNQPRSETQTYQDQTLRLIQHLNERLAELTGEAGFSKHLELIVQSLVEYLDGDSGELWLYHAEAGQLAQEISTMPASDRTADGPAGLTQELIDLVGRERQPQLVQDYPKWAPEAGGRQDVGSTLCAMAVPVWAADQFKGVLAISSDRDGYFFGEQDLLVADLFARLIAVALQASQRLQTIQHLAISDSLTGVWTRSRFLEMAEHAFRQAVRYQRPLSVILVDIDRFKMLNEMHGYGVGDQVLETVANNIVSRLRDSDLLGRYGGEEFMLLLPETDLEHARLAAERMRSQIAAAPTETRKGIFFVTISAGVASLESAAVDQLDQLLDLVDQAMRSAKLAGRNQVAIFESEAE